MPIWSDKFITTTETSRDALLRRRCQDIAQSCARHEQLKGYASWWACRRWQKSYPNLLVKCDNYHAKICLDEETQS